MNGSGAGRAPWGRLGALALIALLVAAVVLGLYVYRARTPDLALEVTKFPNELRDRASVDIEFFVRFDSADATVELVGRDQALARTLAAGFAVESEVPIVCTWDGLNNGGEPVDAGRYRLRVTLPEEDRVMVFPARLDVQPGERAEPDAEGSQPTESCEQGVAP